MKKLFPVIFLLTILLSVSCSQTESKGVTAQIGSLTVSSDSGAMTNTEKTITITGYGTYTVTGSVSDGQIIINTGKEEPVTLILNNADITCLNDAAIYVENADEVIIQTADGSKNSISDGENISQSTEATGAIYSKDDITFSGSGLLTVTGVANNGIVSKNDVKIESGTVTVTAANHGIKGKDKVKINGGKVDITAGGDGIKANEDNDPKDGIVKIDGGEIVITAGDDGIQAFTQVLISAGNITVTAADDGISSDSLVTIDGGSVSITTDNNGIKSAGKIELNAGKLIIDTEDDDFVCLSLTGGNADITVNGSKKVID